ncbi:hypothetical protein [Desulforamulus hydrothermalis]|uniref:Uncharacterized protein n=1 Tax=Desulforamulus hydrothermalis Lam5 = DSM 18033 TaxID=1121428 RepID=K8DY54_9FIRM|nr:hypothetical protein [Desulforamulus hydrothermalis]CCO07717.1 conserved hypothetical protein [Desulforamulus hydrothermalis Lam5 = DSM 18033]SHH33659.1 hypothetical protein SAMN02745177_02230 [Desulforamulus hydrothermalis Lam5 = DSM 18033]
MAGILPLRFRILHHLSTVDKASVDEVMKALEPEYGTEKQFKKEVFLDHLLDMKANFIIDDNEAVINDKGELVIYYSINEEGRTLLKKYLPKWWQKH